MLTAKGGLLCFFMEEKHQLVEGEGSWPAVCPWAVPTPVQASAERAFVIFEQRVCRLSDGTSPGHLLTVHVDGRRVFPKTRPWRSLPASHSLAGSPSPSVPTGPSMAGSEQAVWAADVSDVF